MNTKGNQSVFLSVKHRESSPVEHPLVQAGSEDPKQGPSSEAAASAAFPTN